MFVHVEPAGTEVLIQRLARNRDRQYKKPDHLFKMAKFSSISFSVSFDFLSPTRCLFSFV